MTSQIKPFDTYFGGKAGSGTYQTIINQIPPHRVYIEPFVGGGAIFRHKRPADITILADTDVAVVDQWIAAGVPERGLTMIEQSQMGAQVTLADALILLQSHKVWFDRKDTFLYIDPPYPLDSRKSTTRYTCELTDDHHWQLLEILDRYRHARIAISTYPNDIYSERLAHWRRVEFESQTRGGMATEWLFMNYDEPTELHDYSYVGNDYRERERIAKKVRRHVKKFNALPDLERKALLSALVQERQ